MNSEATMLLIGATGIPAVIGLTELIKETARPPRRFWRLIAVLVAVALNTAFGYALSLNTAAMLAEGLIVGLVASGLYDATHPTTPHRLP